MSRSSVSCGIFSGVKGASSPWLHAAIRAPRHALWNSGTLLVDDRRQSWATPRPLSIGCCFRRMRRVAGHGCSAMCYSRSSSTLAHSGDRKAVRSRVSTARDAPRKRRGSTSAVPSSGVDSSRAKRLSRTAVEQRQEETKLMENDTRLAMRMLMTRHFSQEYMRKKPEDLRLEEERRQLKAKHEQRLQRIEAKNRCSLRLLGADRNSIGDGVLPLFSSDQLSPHDDIDAPPEKHFPAWMTLNPVGHNLQNAESSERPAIANLQQEEQQQGAFTITASLQTLCAPDLSVYDSERDRRINSAEALKAEAERYTVSNKNEDAPRRCALTGVPLEEENLGSDKSHHCDAIVDTPLVGLGNQGRSIADVRWRSLEEDEYPDFAITAYELNEEE